VLRRIDQACKAVLTDSCSVQNVLSSATLLAACTRGLFSFAVTKYCLYECLDKPRKTATDGDLAIRQRLREARIQGSFREHDLSVEDLQEAALLRLRKRVGAGELSTIALAKRFGIGVQTDDDRAEKLAAEVLGNERVQTTPHVLGWMFFHGLLADYQLDVVLAEHRGVGRNLSERFKEAHLEACRVRLLARSSGGE
jgi:hypothetical protein